MSFVELCPTVVRSFEFSQNQSFDAAMGRFGGAAKKLLKLLVVGATAADIATTRAALHREPIYTWLKEKLPRGTQLSQEGKPLDELVALLAVLAQLIANSDIPTPSTPGRRPDKERKTAAAAVTKVQQYLNSGVIGLTEDKASQLWALLVDAKSALTISHPKAVKYPALLATARVLNLCGIGRTDVLLEVAQSAGMNCDESTASNYIDQARTSRAQSNRP